MWTGKRLFDAEPSGAIKTQPDPCNKTPTVIQEGFFVERGVEAAGLRGQPPKKKRQFQPSMLN